MADINDRYRDQWVDIDQSNTSKSSNTTEQKIAPQYIIEQAIKNLAADIGAVLEAKPLKAFRSLYQTDPANYARYRAQIKEIKGVSLSLFDKLTQIPTAPATLAESDPITTLFYPLKVWEHPIQGEDLLNDIKHTLKRYIIADDATLTASTLWACFTWFIDVVSYAPIANITAPEKRCGKTKLLSLLKRLSYQSFTTSNISAAALFRLIELYKPTLLIDEVDSFLNLHEDMRGIINSGFTREGAFIVRCVGDEQIPTPFNVWGAKALCGIGKIADTLQDRSITLKLRRKTQGESVQNVDKSDPKQWEVFRAKLARFAQDNKAKLRNMQIQPLPQLNDRANDCFEPLLQIATLAGDYWLEMTKKAAISLHGEQEENDSTRTELLRDIQNIFNTKKIDRIFSHELTNALNEDNEANWCTWNKGRGITARNLAKTLKEFDIISKNVRIGIEQQAKGYTKDQFKDAFNRYLTTTFIDTPVLSVPTSQDKAHSKSNQNNKRPSKQMGRIENQPEALQILRCDVGTDKIPSITEKDINQEQKTLSPHFNNQHGQNHQNNLKNPHSINELMDNDEGVYFDLD